MDNLVSVVIRTWNRSHYLKEAIESVLNQTYKNIEIIIVDDGSIDNTADIIKGYGEKVRYQIQKHSGVSRALNSGIKSSRGSFLAFLDDDDLWHNRMIEKTVQTLERKKEWVSGVFVDCEYFQGNKKENIIDKRVRRISGDLFESLIKDNFVPINTILVKKKCVEKVGFCDESLEGYEDWDLLLRMILSGFKFEFISEPLALIRIHDSNTSSSSLLMKQNRLKVLEKLGNYENGDFKRVQFIKKEIGKRRLLLGWYLIYSGDLLKGKEEFFKVSPVGTMQRIQKEIFRILLVVHPFFLKKLYSFFKCIYDQPYLLPQNTFFKKKYSFFPSRIKSGH